MRKCVIGLVLLLVAAWSSVAYPTVIAIGQPGDPLGEPLVHEAGGIATVEISLDFFTSIAGVSFALDISRCTGWTLLDVQWNPAYLTLGDIETGVQVAFVGCKTTTPLTIATLTFLSDGTDECCPLILIPHPGSTSGDIEGYDCASQTVTLWSNNGMLAPEGSGYACAAPFPPTNPSPPDGATNQLLSPTLNWDWEPAPLGCGLGICFMYARVGTDLQHWNSNGGEQYPPLDIGPLQPNTTYYWQVIHDAGDWGVGTEGPIWSFTTTDGVAAETSTWGRIKALYQ